MEVQERHNKLFETLFRRVDGAISRPIFGMFLIALVAVLSGLFWMNYRQMENQTEIARDIAVIRAEATGSSKILNDGKSERLLYQRECDKRLTEIEKRLAVIEAAAKKGP